jgi:undecaprenyl-phosphate 4-deoxy-4-formamido-L-arabinose transferase
MKLVSVVIPVYNEEASLGELIDRCLATCRALDTRSEIILVDDGSRDRSREMITEAATRYEGEIVGILLNRNYGQHAAVLAGFDESRGDVVVTLDADLQNPPEEIPKLLAKVDEGCDVVGSVRRNRQDPLFRRMASKVINRAVQKVTGVTMTDYGCMLRAYRRDVVNAILQCRERSVFIPVLANSFANRTDEVEVRHAERTGGESKYDLWKLFNLQFDLLTGMTTFPLRVLTLIGALIATGGFGLGLFILAMRLILGSGWAAQGVFTLFAVLFFLTGAQFVALGLVGEYIGRIYTDVRARPRYFVHRLVGRVPSSPPKPPSPVESP